MVCRVGVMMGGMGGVMMCVSEWWCVVLGCGVNEGLIRDGCGVKRSGMGFTEL